MIIPVYNVEKYVSQCIDSILNQTYKDYEIIIINDGSTDNSEKICKKYEEKYENIKLYCKENGGLSSARNYGIKFATGKYLLFVDSDDFLDSNMIENLVKGCEEFNCEIGVIGIYKYYNENKFTKESNFKNFEKVDSNTALIELFLNGFYVCNKLFKKELFDKNKFENKLYEDLYLIPYLVEKNNNIYISRSYGYYYRQRNSSIVHSKFDMRKMDYYYAIKKIYSHFKNNKAIYNALNAFYILSLSNLILDVYPERKKYKKEYKLFYKELKNMKFIKNRYISKEKKIMLIFHIFRLTNIVDFIKKKM